jgi:hypothetical protein
MFSFSLAECGTLLRGRKGSQNGTRKRFAAFWYSDFSGSFVYLAAISRTLFDTACYGSVSFLSI